MSEKEREKHISTHNEEEQEGGNTKDEPEREDAAPPKATPRQTRSSSRAYRARWPFTSQVQHSTTLPSGSVTYSDLPRSSSNTTISGS